MSKGVNPTVATVATVAFSVTSFLGGFIVGVDLRTKRLRNEAVDAGVAEYYLDANHTRQWRWLNDREEE